MTVPTELLSCDSCDRRVPREDLASGGGGFQDEGTFCSVCRGESQ